MSFRRITDKETIRKLMDAYMLRPGEQPAPFLASIGVRRGCVWNGRTKSSPLAVDLARPLSATEGEDGERVYTLTNGDSRYTEPIGVVKLSEVEYIELAR